MRGPTTSCHPPLTQARQQVLTLRNDLAELPRLAAFIDAFCAPLRPGDQDTLALQLALEETVTNVINHGYRDGLPHTFNVTLSADDSRRITVMVDDDAPAFDPLARPPVDTGAPLEARPVGGLGIHLVRKLVDRARYERRDGRNILTLERTLRPLS
ncbi:anti-sigma regulatory factor (Ser/Thr protein kinase) [Opitutaceae bacterium TAV1]|nr:anti-sigma regulatory factor (Ser/Thr protein kinase) [Opitutaceae bacterium TAV1]